LGQKYKARFPAVRQTILDLNPEEAAQLLQDGKPVHISLDGEQLEILPSEVEVRREARSGLTIASEGSFLCALKTDLTPELVNEGLSREFVRHVQEARKQAELELADRIHLYIEATPGLASAIDVHKETIMGETLAVTLDFAPAPEFITPTQAAFDGETVSFGLLKAV
jgi:isoleucyl-tRNA synthetase